MPTIVTTDSNLARVEPPRLPAAPVEYDSRFIENYSNILRLYFNRVTTLMASLSSASGIIPALTTYTVATLPSAATSGAGARAFVSDATATTFASVVAGGGANKVPVYSDGTNWKVG